MKKNVLMIGPSINGNGGIASVIKSYSESNKLNSKIELISSYKDGNKVKKLIEFIKGLTCCFYKLALNKNIDIVHIHSASRASFERKKYFLKLSKLFNKKVILHIHGAEFMEYYNECSFKKKDSIKEVITSADIVIALSRKWKEDLSRISDRDNIKVVYNPVVVDKFYKSNCEKENIVFMGRVGKRKGIYDLIEVMPQVINDFPNVNLYICGDGELDKVKKIIEKNKLSKNVLLMGWVNEEKKISILKESSINVLPSYNEGMPISILEAMSSGVPTLATNIAGIPEEIENKKNGYLFNPGEVQTLYEYIVSLLNDKDLRSKMGDEALKKVKKNFDISVIESQLIAVYKNM